MELDVFDTYVTHQDGHKIHFDVLLPKGSTPEQAKGYAIKWLKSIRIQVEGLQLDSCRFCHSLSRNGANCYRTRLCHFTNGRLSCSNPLIKKGMKNEN